jgi:hypothetical protein
MAAMESMGTSIHCHQHSKELAVAKGMGVSRGFDDIHDKPQEASATSKPKANQQRQPPHGTKFCIIGLYYLSQLPPMKT